MRSPHWSRSTTSPKIKRAPLTYNSESEPVLLRCIPSEDSSAVHIHRFLCSSAASLRNVREIVGPIVTRMERKRNSNSTNIQSQHKNQDKKEHTTHAMTFVFLWRPRINRIVRLHLRRHEYQLIYLRSSTPKQFLDCPSCSQLRIQRTAAHSVKKKIEKK